MRARLDVAAPAARILGSEVLLDGEDMLVKPEIEMAKISGRMAAMILQDPMSSLNPVFCATAKRQLR